MGDRTVPYKILILISQYKPLKIKGGLVPLLIVINFFVQLSGPGALSCPGTDKPKRCGFIFLYFFILSRFKDMSSCNMNIVSIRRLFYVGSNQYILSAHIGYRGNFFGVLHITYGNGKKAEKEAF